jgi:hypothetical protein
MNEVTATKKTRKANTQSKAAQIRKLFAQGKLTPKQIGEKVNAPMPYVYVVRSKMKAEAGGLPAVAETKIPVLGGIQDIHYQPPTAMQAPIPALTPMQITMVEPPTFFQRVKDKVRAWLS